MTEEQTTNQRIQEIKHREADRQWYKLTPMDQRDSQREVDIEWLLDLVEKQAAEIEELSDEYQKLEEQCRD